MSPYCSASMGFKPSAKEAVIKVCNTLPVALGGKEFGAQPSPGREVLDEIVVAIEPANGACHSLDVVRIDEQRCIADDLG